MTHSNVSLESPKSYEIALKALFNIMEEWQVNEEKQRVLLCNPATDVFERWKCGEVTSLESDVLERISYVIGIYKNLGMLFQVRTQANEWLHKQNNAFGGASALNFMLLGQTVNFRKVRHYLDAQL